MHPEAESDVAPANDMSMVSNEFSSLAVRDTLYPIPSGLVNLVSKVAAREVAVMNLLLRELSPTENAPVFRLSFLTHRSRILAPWGTGTI